MTHLARETEFSPDWPAPSPRFLRDLLPPAPKFPLEDIFCPEWAAWIKASADGKSAPVDYVVAGLLAAAGAGVGNTRWVSPWQGWAEPPVLWHHGHWIALRQQVPRSGRSADTTETN